MIRDEPRRCSGIEGWVVMCSGAREGVSMGAGTWVRRCDMVSGECEHEAQLHDVGESTWDWRCVNRSKVLVEVGGISQSFQRQRKRSSSSTASISE